MEEAARGELEEEESRERSVLRSKLEVENRRLRLTEKPEGVSHELRAVPLRIDPSSLSLA